MLLSERNHEQPNFERCRSIELSQSTCTQFNKDWQNKQLGIQLYVTISVLAMNQFQTEKCLITLNEAHRCQSFLIDISLMLLSTKRKPAFLFLAAFDHRQWFFGASQGFRFSAPMLKQYHEICTHFGVRNCLNVFETALFYVTRRQRENCCFQMPPNFF